MKGAKGVSSTASSAYRAISGLALATIAPNVWIFGVALVITGVSGLTFTAATSSLISTEPAMRGRVMALCLAILVGATPVGAPLVGWVADTFGPRWALSVGAASGIAAAAVALRYVVRQR